jgi:hypothetical protein
VSVLKGDSREVTFADLIRLSGYECDGRTGFGHDYEENSVNLRKLLTGMAMALASFLPVALDILSTGVGHAQSQANS